MIKSPALRMGIAMAAIASGTYYGLDRLPQGLLPPPIGRAMAAEVPAETAPAPVTITAVTPVAASTAAADESTAEASAEATPETATEATTEAPPPVEPAAAPSEAQPAPAAAPSETAQPEPPAPKAAPTETAKADSAAPTRSAPAADVIKPWWPDPAQMPANQLKLQYAGQVQGQGAIALLFSAPLQLETVQQNVTVRSAAGETVAGAWTLGKNPKLAVLGGLAPGRYTVILQPQVADQKGFMLGTTLTGPVYVKEP